MRFILTYIFSVFFSTSFLFGQLDHYWGQVYNPESALLSGAVVSGNGASGGGFFNPATMSFVESSSFSLTFNLISAQQVNFDNALGQSKDIETINFVLRPRFFAFLIKPDKFDDRVVIEAMYMNRNNYEMDFGQSFVLREDILDRFAGNENYGGSYSFSQRYDEHMYGLAFAKKMSSHFSLGTTAFLIYKSQRMIEELSMEAAPKSYSQAASSQVGAYDVASYLNREMFDFYNYRFLIKFGANYSTKKFGLGLTLTMPTINLFSGASVEKTYRVSNIDVGVDANAIGELLVKDAQYDLNGDFKDPFSFALGAHYDFGNFLITGTAQYFGQIEQYRAIEANVNVASAPEEILSQFEQPDFLSYYYGVNSVLNMAIGLRYSVSQYVFWYTGFRTDFSTMPEYKEYNEYFSNTTNFLSYDLYHATVGGRFKKDRFELVLGVQYSFAPKQTVEQFGNMDNPSEYRDGEYLQGEKSNTMIFNYNELSLLTGVTYSFISELVKKK